MQLVQQFRLMGTLKWIYYIQSAWPSFIHMTWESKPENIHPLPRNGEML